MIHGTSDNFEKEVMQADGLVLVDFWAQWCGPCQMLAPVLVEIEKECPEITICKVDVEENMELAQSYKVSAIPLLVLFRQGEVLEKLTGLQSKDDLLEVIRKYL